MAQTTFINYKGLVQYVSSKVFIARPFEREFDKKSWNGLA